MDRLANAVILSWGWRRRGIALRGAGALSALAMPPFFAFPILWITLPVLVWLIDGAVAEARSGRVRRLGPAFADRLVVRLRLFPRRALVDRQRVPGGGRRVRLADAARRHRASRRAGALLGLRRGARAASLERGLAAHLRARRGARRRGMAARPPPLRLSLERHRLCADRRRNPDAVGGALRHLCSERHRRRDLRRAGGARAGDRRAAAQFRAARRSRVARASRRSGSTACCACRRRRPPSCPTSPSASCSRRSISCRNGIRTNKDEVLSTYFRLSAPEGAPLAKGTMLVWPESAFPFPLTQDPGVLAAIAELLPAGTALVTGAYREEYPPNGERQVYNTHLRDRRRRDDPRRLRQGAPRAVRRISAGAANCSSGYGLRQLAPQPLLARAVAAADHAAVRAALPAAHLLRGRYSPARSCGDGAAAGLHAQPDERWLVRPHHRPLPAFPSGARAQPSRKDCRWCARQIPASRR